MQEVLTGQFQACCTQLQQQLAAEDSMAEAEQRILVQLEVGASQQPPLTLAACQQTCCKAG